MAHPVVNPPVPVLVAEWQFSHAVDPTGTWMEEDNVTNVGALYKVTPAAWQVAQPDVLPFAA